MIVWAILAKLENSRSEKGQPETHHIAHKHQPPLEIVSCIYMVSMTGPNRRENTVPLNVDKVLHFIKLRYL